MLPLFANSHLVRRENTRTHERRTTLHLAVWWALSSAPHNNTFMNRHILITRLLDVFRFYASFECIQRICCVYLHTNNPNDGVGVETHCVMWNVVGEFMNRLIDLCSFLQSSSWLKLQFRGSFFHFSHLLNFFFLSFIIYYEESLFQLYVFGPERVFLFIYWLTLRWLFRDDIIGDLFPAWTSAMAWNSASFYHPKVSYTLAVARVGCVARAPWARLPISIVCYFLLNIRMKTSI